MGPNMKRETRSDSIRSDRTCTTRLECSKILLCIKFCSVLFSSTFLSPFLFFFSHVSKTILFCYKRLNRKRRRKRRKEKIKKSCERKLPLRINFSNFNCFLSFFLYYDCLRSSKYKLSSRLLFFCFMKLK